MSIVCPTVRASKVCTRPGCEHIHTVYRCRVCRAPFATQMACTQHETSAAASHKKKTVHKEKTIHECTICSVTSMDPVSYNLHIRGKRHKKTLAASKSQAQAVPVNVEVTPQSQWCTICGADVPKSSWAAHVRGRRHLSRQTAQSLANTLALTENDKHGIGIDSKAIDFGTVEGTAGTVTKQIKVINNSRIVTVLTSAKLSTTTHADIFRVVEATRRRQLNHTTSTTVKVTLSASKKHRGLFENRLELCFEIPSQQRRFIITRAITARIGSNSDYEELKVTKPYVRRMRIRGNKFARFIVGVRPQALAAIVWTRKLGSYDMPQGLEDILSKDDMKTFEKLNIIRSTFMTGEFGPIRYVWFNQMRLWVEEDQASRELSEYDMEAIQLTPRGSLYALEVPGLAEKRPSVIVGDRFLVSASGSVDAIAFEGFVHRVENRLVMIHFNKKFQWSIGRRYDVHFDLNRLVFRRMHQALTCASDVGRITFPSEELSPISAASVQAIRPYDSKIANNEPQHRAVASIFRMPAGSVPFIVYGPPGTGKTVTIVEAIRQIVARKPDARILACAPSNSAADIIVERLAEHISVIGDKAMHRLIAPSRSPQMISSTVLSFTRVNEYNVFECPPLNELETFRVIVSTCCSGGVPYGIGFKPGHFTHIFIDEAAQATEPEVMIPIKTIIGPDTNIILSGDVKQLGPIVRSPIARELGLDVSFVQRLMSTSVYDEDTAKGKSLVKLTKNYRSHPEILKFPNAEFYKNELEACARREITHSITGRWDGLVKDDYPIVFHGVCGQDMREDPSPSYFNIDEASIVRDYVKSLLDADLRLRPEDIGIIAPYRAQVLRLRQLLKTFAQEARVGSVEEFQGQERKVIIISTVRSSPDKISFDLRHTLGFVASPRRFNVAVTRAQALLVVVGDPYVLSLDPMWKGFINHVSVRGGYTGVDLDWDTTEPVDRTARLDEARRAQGLSELEDLIRRTSDLNLGDDDDDEVEDPGAFREDE